jgi:NDP-sugar pyrophosphorylase family protein
MILAAGFGTRLRPMTENIPKPLIPVAGHPMIAYAIALLRSAGIVDIIINVHHLGEQIVEALGDGSAYGVSLTYSREDVILDTGGGIKKAESFLAGSSFVVVNADTVINLDLQEVIAWHRRCRALATMVLRRDPDAERYGTIEIDAESRIRRFLGRPAQVGEQLSAFMFAGVHVFEPALFRYLGEGAFSITRSTYVAMLAAEAPLYGFPFEGYWRVLDTPAGLAVGQQELERPDTLMAPLRP